jgi:hypothetical protein
MMATVGSFPTKVGRRSGVRYQAGCAALAAAIERATYQACRKLSGGERVYSGQRYRLQNAHGKDARVGFTKRHLEEIESRGWADSDSTVCSSCVLDEALVAAVVDYGGTEACDFCGATRKVASAPLEVVLDLVVDGVRFEFEDPVEQSAYDSEDGYLVPTWDTWDLLESLEVTDRADVLDAIAGAMRQGLWCQRDPYAVTPTQALEWGWQAFRTFVKESRRYTFLVPDPSTADGAGALAMHSVPTAIASAVASSALVATLPPGSKWWRARVGAGSETFSAAREIGTPPATHAKVHRMSPKGIGAFYGASTLDGAVLKVAGYADPTAMLSVGQFELIQSIRVVDLREVAPVPSLFDPQMRPLRAPITFLQSFVEDISTPSSPTDHQNLEYVPTQVITEYLRYELPAKLGPIEGVIWRSSRDRSVDVCALFIAFDEIADAGSETANTRMVLNPSTVIHRTVEW